MQSKTSQAASVEHPLRDASGTRLQRDRVNHALMRHQDKLDRLDKDIVPGTSIPARSTCTTRASFHHIFFKKQP